MSASCRCHVSATYLCHISANCCSLLLGVPSERCGGDLQDRKRGIHILTFYSKN
jgi:hypothetical protein